MKSRNFVVAIVLGVFVVAGNSPVRAQGKGHGNGNGMRSRKRRPSAVDMAAVSTMIERWTITRLAGGTWSIVAICRLG
jgi:hypothetical protein